MRKELGKIKSARLGHVGYQSAMLGVQFDLGGEGWGVGDSWGSWDYELVNPSEFSKWTEEDKTAQHVETLKKVSKLLKDAKVSSVAELAGTPIEIIFDGNTLEEWRVLTEVI